MKKVESLHTWQPPHPTIVCGRRYGVRQQRKSFPHLSMAANRDGIVDNRLPTGCFFSLDSHFAIRSLHGDIHLVDVANQLRIDNEMFHAVGSGLLSDAGNGTEKPLIYLTHHEMVPRRALSGVPLLCEGGRSL